MSHASEAIRVLSIVIGIIMLMIGFLVIVVALIPPASGLIAFFGIIFFSAGVLMIYFGTKREEAVPVRPLPTGGTTEVRPKASEETVIMPSPPAKTTVVRLATLSSPRGNLYITDVVQEFGRSNFTGIVPEEDLKLISRMHFRTRLQGGKIYIEDLGSANGTFVNDVDIRGRGLVSLERGSLVNIAGVIEFKVEY